MPQKNHDMQSQFQPAFPSGSVDAGINVAIHGCAPLRRFCLPQAGQPDRRCAVGSASEGHRIVPAARASDRRQLCRRRPPVRFSGFDYPDLRDAPAPGQHTDEINRELGLGDA